LSFIFAISAAELERHPSSAREVEGRSRYCRIENRRKGIEGEARA